MSSPTRIQALVPQAVAALNRRDLDGFLRLVSPEVEFVPLVAGVEGGVYSGHEGVRRWLEDTWSTMEGYEIAVEVLEEIGGDVGLLRVDLRLRGRGSGVEVQTDAYQVAELDPEGRMRRWRFYELFDEARAVARDWAGGAAPRS